MPVKIICLVCGIEFAVPPSRAKAGARYCSLACRDKHMIGELHPTWRGGLVIKQCLVCGKETAVKPSHAKKGEGKFCSRTCQGQWASQNALGYDPKRRIEKKCIICGASIFVKKSHAEIEGTYCSRECMSVGYKSALRGDFNPNYRHGKAYTAEWRNEWARQWWKKNPDKRRVWNAQTKTRRKKAKGKYTIRDIAYLMRCQLGKCALCGCDIKDLYHVDHRIPIARGGHNYVGNLQLLCPTCNLRKGTKFMVELRYRTD